MQKKYIFLFDLIVVAIAPLIALFIRYDYSEALVKLDGIWSYQLLLTFVAAICFLVLGTYKSFWRHMALPDFIRILAAVTIAMAITLIFDFLVFRLEGMPRAVPPIQWFFTTSMLVGARLLVRSVLVSPRKRIQVEHGDHKEHVLVVGLNHVAELYLRCVDTLSAGHIVVEGLLDEIPDNRGRLLLKHKVIGAPSELQNILDKYRLHGVAISSIVIAEPFSELSGASQETLLHWERNGLVKLDLFEERLGFHNFSRKATSRQPNIVPLQGTDILRTDLEDGLYPMVKRIFDIVGALGLAVICSPLIVLATILVMIDVGYPAIFWQRRIGKYGVPFTLYKFRTMRAKHDIAYGDRSQNLKIDQERTSKIGYFLRKTRMDELPQLYHILTGEMSFVGPRPLLKAYQPKNSKIRLSVTPGITGWAQIHGGDKLSADEKLALDIWYLHRMSWLMDIEILFKTFMVAFKGDIIDRDMIRAAQEEIRDMGIQAPSSGNDNKVSHPMLKTG